MNFCLSLFLASCIHLCVAEMYVLDDRFGLGRRFDGIGGLSGGGVSYLSTPVYSSTFYSLHDLPSVAMRAKKGLICNNVLLGYFQTTGQL